MTLAFLPSVVQGGLLPFTYLEYIVVRHSEWSYVKFQLAD